MAGWAPSAPAQQRGARYARAILAGLPNAELGRLRVVSPTASGLPREKESQAGPQRESTRCARSPLLGEGGVSSPSLLSGAWRPSPITETALELGSTEGEMGRAWKTSGE